MTAVFEPEIWVNQGGQNYTLLQHVFRGYQLYMRTEGHASSTITVTTCCISKLLRFLETFNHPTDVRNIGPNQIRSYILYLQERRAWANHPYIKCRERPLSPTTINDYLRPLSAFWSWLVS